MRAAAGIGCPESPAKERNFNPGRGEDFFTRNGCGAPILLHKPKLVQPFCRCSCASASPGEGRDPELQQKLVPGLRRDERIEGQVFILPPVSGLL
jgi:hypothetical protein